MRRALACLPLALLLHVGCARTPRGGILQEPAPAHDSFVDYVPQSGESWERISELYFGDASRARRIAEEAGSTLDQAPKGGAKLRIRIAPDEMDRVRRIEVARGPYNEGVELLRAGDRDRQALAAFERALELAPYFVDARYNQGLALIRVERGDEAVRALNEVVQARPGDKDAHYALASAHFQLEAFARALELLERALALDRGFLRAQYTKAMSLQRLGRAGEAREAWQRYLELDSTSAWAHEARRQLRQL